MSCELSRTIVHGYLDGELDAARATEFEQHLEGCRDCASALEAQQTLRTTLSRGGLYERAPASLRRRVSAEIGAGRSSLPAWSPDAWRWLATAAVAALLFLAVWSVVPRLMRTGGEELIVAQAVDAHLRSLQPGHLTDVPSSDQHTVKPWFDGKVDFAPPVRDLAAEGFPLAGGRLDVVGGRTVAALVYGRRKHYINVFLWPTVEPDAAARSGAVRGYHWEHWRSRGMEFCAVSDVDAADLAQLARLLGE